MLCKARSKHGYHTHLFLGTQLLCTEACFFCLEGSMMFADACLGESFSLKFLLGFAAAGLLLAL